MKSLDEELQEVKNRLEKADYKESEGLIQRITNIRQKLVCEDCQKPEGSVSSLEAIVSILHKDMKKLEERISDLEMQR